MTIQIDVAVTYIGRDNPFKDRIYRSGLTFTPGQTRLVPETLAARFLRHSDVFRRAEIKQPALVPQAPASEQQGLLPVADQSELTDNSVDQPDDTQALLDTAKKQEEGTREQDNARFEMLESIESMDRSSLIDWADTHYKQKIPGNVSVAKAREIARGFIDQYGMPV